MIFPEGTWQKYQLLLFVLFNREYKRYKKMFERIATENWYQPRDLHENLAMYILAEGEFVPKDDFETVVLQSIALQFPEKPLYGISDSWVTGAELIMALSNHGATVLFNHHKTKKQLHLASE